MRFRRVKRAAKPREGGSGLDVFDTDVAEEIDPRGLPVWNTFVMLMCRGDILPRPRCPTREYLYIYVCRGGGGSGGAGGLIRFMCRMKRPYTNDDVLVPGLPLREYIFSPRTPEFTRSKSPVFPYHNLQSQLFGKIRNPRTN